jgi:hypothetical protein
MVGYRTGERSMNAKPSDKITATMSRSEWNKYISGMTSSDVEVRHKIAIELSKKLGLD